MDNGGMAWVIGALLVIAALVLIVSGGTGHAQQLFSGIFGTAGTASASTTSASDTAIDATLTGLLTSSGTPSTSSNSGTVSPASVPSSAQVTV